MVKVERSVNNRICQGDILKDIEYLEYAIEKEGHFEISKILFPMVIVLTQDCDLTQDFKFRRVVTDKDQDKHLLSVIVAPLYNAEHLYNGEHMSELGLQMQKISKNKSPGENLRKNEVLRYHYLEFPNEIPIVPSVIDFKHYFTINVEYALMVKEANFVCKISELYREFISQRFANYLSRIGLPSPDDI